ncbi:hypothetical protein TREES_T100011888 [Tupaia chinensis]|uniref:Uncharacterized protein n=1 Tax=Tupaia chinensis TaxID=246437 RepID=L9KWA1_TUPCH|nr:hypothetical protein TREES_T100011888 [Tupaia chinensis]
MGCCNSKDLEDKNDSDSSNSDRLLETMPSEPPVISLATSHKGLLLWVGTFILEARRTLSSVQPAPCGSSFPLNSHSCPEEQLWLWTQKQSSLHVLCSVRRNGGMEDNFLIGPRGISGIAVSFSHVQALNRNALRPVVASQGPDIREAGTHRDTVIHNI